MHIMNNKAPSQTHDDWWSRFSMLCREAFHRYGSWLVEVHWRRFFSLALVSILAVAVIKNLPPFSWEFLNTRVELGAPLMPLTLWSILISIIVKLSYKGTVQAEAKAALATEVAESESLKRQVVEARMAAMQAQVEPHFLFNTLASIEHLIETDPARAGKMQRNLIALLRASMPTMREANAQGTRDLGRELAVIRPYLEILKVRMEERLQTIINVSDGLLSAEFPPMMLQSLVENAIKHGLEPKADGGQLTVSAEIVHGKLAVSVVDTGLGFGKSATTGTGIGLSNIRERLALLYGNKGSLKVMTPQSGGTSVTITVPYVVCTQAEATV
jgi:LytS/YehU family sensor histidine kinase